MRTSACIRRDVPSGEKGGNNAAVSGVGTGTTRQSAIGSDYIAKPDDGAHVRIAGARLAPRPPENWLIICSKFTAASARPETMLDTEIFVGEAEPVGRR